MKKRALFAFGAALTLCFAPNLRAESTAERLVDEHPFRMITHEVQELTAKANAGNSRAQFKLAEMYENGRGGLSKDISYAMSWYEEAARNGNRPAQKHLRALGSIE